MRKGAAVGIGAAVLAVLVGPVLLIAAVAGVAVLGSAGGATSSGSDCYGTSTGAGPELSDEQQANAAAIVSTVSGRGLPTQDAVIAVMTALTESSLINVAHGDVAGPDSTGLFQQRDSWGPRDVRMDPTGATNLFLDALTSPELKVYGAGELVNAADTSRYQLAPWVVAQSVQRSAFADGSNYRVNYSRAASVVAGLTGAQASADGWQSADVTGLQVPQLVTGQDSDLTLTTLNCQSDLDTGGTSGAGAWGGYANGRIPLEVLAPIPWAPGQHARPDAVNALIALNTAFRAQFGKDIAITDSYRSFEEQVATKAAKGWLAAVPGTSNHGWGLALDLGSGINRFGTAEHMWMQANAPAYGWIHPDWARQGGSKPEPWHWEYRATESAGGQA